MRNIHVLLVAIALIGCDATPGADQFVGTWHRVKYPKETVTVAKESDGLVFIAHDYTSKQALKGKLIGDQVVIDALTTASLRDNGNLVYAGREYTK